LVKTCNVGSTKPIDSLVIVSDDGQPDIMLSQPTSVQRELNRVVVLKLINKNVPDMGRDARLTL
jgi:hypothetical protein